VVATKTSKKTRKISKKEFVERFTELTVRYFSRFSPEEQEKRLSAAERRLAKIFRERRPTPSHIPETQPIHLSARNHRAED